MFVFGGWVGVGDQRSVSNPSSAARINKNNKSILKYKTKCSFLLALLALSFAFIYLSISRLLLLLLLL